jgi:putative PIN family toxin of toxin-antitoxin system
VRAVLDANVIISALLLRSGSPAVVLRAWQDGQFELIVSPLLLAEIERALAYPKLRRRISAEEAEAVLDWLRRAATVAPDPPGSPTMQSLDPGDDFLLALAAAEHAVLVSGDDHLVLVAGEAPIHSPASFLSLLDGQKPQASSDCRQASHSARL